MTQPDPNEHSEFGGSPGLIQPPPHELTAYEEARLMRATEAGDETSDVSGALAQEWEREGRL